MKDKKKKKEKETGREKNDAVRIRDDIQGIQSGIDRGLAAGGMEPPRNPHNFPRDLSKLTEEQRKRERERRRKLREERTKRLEEQRRKWRLQRKERFGKEVIRNR